MQQVTELLKQKSTWTGLGILGMLGAMVGLPSVAVEQAGTVVIGLLGLFEVVRKEKV